MSADVNDAIRQTVQAFVDWLPTAPPLTIADDIDVTVAADLKTQALTVTLSGKTPYGNAYLAEVLERMEEAQ